MKKSTLFLLTLLLFAFNSCKKDDDIEPIIPTVQEGTALVSTTINEKEIGGNNLSVYSVYYPDAPIKDNSFKTIVSQKGTQVVFVLDENNSLRGLSYTIKNGNNYELVPIDATSTVISLFLLTPGITSTTSEETVKLIDNLESLSSYQKLKTEVQNNLPLNNLEQLLAKDNINTLFEDVILEYIEKISSNSSTKSAKIDLYGNRLSVMKNKDGMVEISNQAFRRINVYRSYIDNNQVTNSKLLFESMNGGVGVSWGSLFTFSSFEPTIKVDEEYLPPTQSAITEYWVIGPGNAESEEMPPSYINKDYDQALTETCIYYVLFPMIDLLNGTSKLIDKDGLVQDVFESTKEIRAGTSGLKYLDDMKNASNKKAFNSAMINYTVLIGETAIAIPAIASSVGVSAEVAETIGTCLAIISIPMSLANLSAFTADYFKQPKYSKFIIETQLNSPILLSPTNNSNLQSTSVKLSWEKNPLAWKYVVEISKKADFEDKIIKTTDGITTNLTITLDPSTLYYWRVYCTKADGSPSNLSKVWSFTTGENAGYETGTVTDYDGNVYKTIKIGNQWWMAENLKVTHYSDGTPLSDGTGLGNFSPFDEGKYWFIYDDSSANKDEYGLLYSWYAVTRGGNSLTSNKNPSGIQGIAPDGWHIPSDAEWRELEGALGFTDADRIPDNYLGCYEIYDLGHMLKEEGDLHWNNQYEVGNDIICIGFNALPSGRKNRDGSFYGLGTIAFFWTTTNRPDSQYYAWERVIGNQSSSLMSCYGSAQYDKNMGYAIRCVKDQE